MKLLKRSTFLLLLLICFACSQEDESPRDGGSGELLNSDGSLSGFATGGGGGGGGSGGPTGGGSGPNGLSSGLITAGEWNDLENWDFWLGLEGRSEFSNALDVWGFSAEGRVSVTVKTSAGTPARDLPVALYSGGSLLYSAKTNHEGRAELFAKLFADQPNVNPFQLSLRVNGNAINGSVRLATEGTNEVRVATAPASTRTELAFLVDATGSMGDELTFLQEDLRNVIDRIESDNPSLDVATATVFYRDVGDDYVTRHSGFSNDITTTTDFIQRQTAGGGGNFPEAVHSALRVGIDQLTWSDEARTRIAFLVLDAPPHTDVQVMEEYREMVVLAAEKGIRIVPVTASGIDKSTEFLMRLTAIGTNASYVFITNDSGIGGDHIEPTIGDFEVEFLNDLMIRLVKEWTE